MTATDLFDDLDTILSPSTVVDLDLADVETRPVEMTDQLIDERREAEHFACNWAFGRHHSDYWMERESKPGGLLY